MWGENCFYLNRITDSLENAHNEVLVFRRKPFKRIDHAATHIDYRAFCDYCAYWDFGHESEKQKIKK